MIIVPGRPQSWDPSSWEKEQTSRRTIHKSHEESTHDNVCCYDREGSTPMDKQADRLDWVWTQRWMRGNGMEGSRVLVEGLSVRLKAEPRMMIGCDEG